MLPVKCEKAYKLKSIVKNSVDRKQHRHCVRTDQHLLMNA